MKKTTLWILVGVVVVCLVAVIVDFAIDGGRVTFDSDTMRETAADRPTETSGAMTEGRDEDSETVAEDEAAEDGETGEDAEETAEPQTEEEKREAEEEKKVNTFDDLTDKWMEPSAKGVTMADIDNFAKSFRQIPKSRQDECIHRALNLIPDENVMLLAGVLMDKSMGKEIIETVYNDILNRDEDVKKPILQQIFKDKTHSCWADTAWILDVTGELPKATKERH